MDDLSPIRLKHKVTMLLKKQLLFLLSHEVQVSSGAYYARRNGCFRGLYGQ